MHPTINFRNATPSFLLLLPSFLPGGLLRKTTLFVCPPQSPQRIRYRGAHHYCTGITFLLFCSPLVFSFCGSPPDDPFQLAIFLLGRLRWPRFPFDGKLYHNFSTIFHEGCYQGGAAVTLLGGSLLKIYIFEIAGRFGAPPKYRTPNHVVMIGSQGS